MGIGRRRTTRMTRQRGVILEILRGTERHPTAEWIHREARRVLPTLSLGTVYRNLSLLARQGAVVALRQAGGQTRYDARTSRHHHFTCQGCGEISDVDEAAADRELARRIARCTGLAVTGCRIEFLGYCRRCAARRPQGRGVRAPGRP